MAKGTYWQRGESIDYVNSGDTKIDANTVILYGSRLGIAGATGPVFAGRMYDVTGSFNLAWIVFGIMFVLVFFVSIIAFRSGEGMDEM